MRISDVINAILLVATIAIIATFAPGAKAQSLSGNVYGAGTQLVVGQTTEGRVLQVALKRAEASPVSQATGTGLGTLVGALLGQSIQDPASRMAASSLGAVLGGIGGNIAASKFASADALEIVVAIKDPRTGSYTNVVTIVEPAPFTTVVAQQDVLLVNMGGQTRVIPKTYDSSPVAMR